MIHPSCLVDPKAHIHPSVEMEAFCIVRGRVIIGEGCKIFSHASIGAIGEHGSEKYEFHPAPNPTGVVYLGKNVVIRSFCTIDAPLGNGGRTSIDDAAYLMAHSHVGHNASLGKNVILSTGARVGGHAVLLDGATMGLNSCCHQHSVLGHYCMVAMGAMVVKDLIPFTKFIPGKEWSVNQHIIDKLGFPAYSASDPFYVKMHEEFSRARVDPKRPVFC